MVLGAMNSSSFDLPELSVPSTQLKESARLLRSSPSLSHGLETLKAVNWGNGESHIIWFLFLRNHYLLFLDIWCLEKKS